MIPVELQRKDTVIIGIDKLEKLFMWRDNNRELVGDFTPVLEEVLLQVGNLAIDVAKTEHPLYTYQFSVYDNGQLQLVQLWNRHNLVGSTLYNDLPTGIKDDEKALHSYIQSVVSIYPVLMAYMEHYREVVEKKEIKHQNVKSKVNKQGKKKKKITYIHNTVYKLAEDIVTDTLTTDEAEKKRSYTSPTDPFKVRGHWRNYKSGKQVWVPGYVKNKKEDQQAEPKTYKV